MSRVWPFSGDVCRRLGAYLSRFWEVISYTMFYPKLHHTRSLINLMTENLEKIRIFLSVKVIKVFCFDSFSQERRPFSQCIFPLKHPTLLEFASSVPDVHLDELTILNSTICLRPPGWGRMPKTNIGWYNKKHVCVWQGYVQACKHVREKEIKV